MQRERRESSVGYPFALEPQATKPDWPESMDGPKDSSKLWDTSVSSYIFEVEEAQVHSIVSIIVPALNEEENISQCVEQLFRAMGDAGYRAEIIVVDDGSTDKTLSVARSLQRQYGSLRILDLRRHYGKSTAIREGVKAAKGDIIAFFDADMQYNPMDLVRMVAFAYEGADVVSGSRDYRTYGRMRTAISRTYNKVLRLLFKVTLSDSNCGMKVLTREAADPDVLLRYGLPLMIPLLAMKGFKLRETPVSLRNRRAGKS